MPTDPTRVSPDSNSVYEGVLFDLDGTLLDTAKDMGNALNYVLNEKGLPACPFSTYQPYASHGSKGMLRSICQI